MMKKVFFILLLSSNLYSQVNITQNSFILHLLEENILTLKSKQNIKCYDPQKVTILLDTLNSNQYVDILFLKFKIDKNTITITDRSLEFNYYSSSCNEYILAYNIINNNSYRLKGFNGNDLLFLLKDLKGQSYTYNSPKKIVSDLNDLNIGINFKEIYKALLKLDFEAECLKSCSDGKPAHGKINR